MRLFHVAAFAALAVGCKDSGTDTTDDTTEDVVDARREFPEAPLGAVVWDTPEWTIPAFSDKQFCYALTYDGDDVGITAQANYQSPNGHHVVIFGTTVSEREMPDGTQWDCTTPESMDMGNLDPLIIGGDIAYGPEGVLNSFILPAGMGASLNNGQRVVIQSHYINATDKAVLVRDEVQLTVVPEDEVEIWAAPFAQSIDGFKIPAGAVDYNETFDCVWEADYNIVYLGGHMHEWGTAFKTDRTVDGVTDTLYEVPVWDPIFRDAPMYQQYEQGEFTVKPGDVFTTSCTWTNDTSNDLPFPNEMCVTFGMVFPSKVPVVCSPQ
jgi:hypothetical protein